MIAFIEGTLIEALPTHVVVNVQGMGYQALIPLSSFDRLPACGSTVHLRTHLHVREDAMILYGFMSAPECDLFRLLLNHVTGVGPKLALAILSGMSVENFKSAVVASDAVAISRISGVGKKTAERVILELKDRVGVAAAWETASMANAPSVTDTHINDAVLALISLGYKQAEAHKAIKIAMGNFKKPDEAKPEDMIREALRSLAG
ncbi:MAG: Holliday junction branch migration protein RuvA [Chthoniobacterales bacterium]